MRKINSPGYRLAKFVTKKEHSNYAKELYPLMYPSYARRALHELIANQKPHIDYNLVPGVVYTWPEVAAVGKTEQELKESNVDFKVGQFPIRALGRARASMDIQGLIKIISDASTDEVLGVHMIAPRAADLIMEAVVAMEYRASAEDIARICHPHPTYSEAVKEAALAATDNRPLHI